MIYFFRRWGAAIILGIIAILALTACSQEQEPIPRFDPIAFPDTRLPLQASAVEVADNSGSPGEPPRIEATLPAPAVPARALSRWPGERLELTGGANQAVFTVETASVTGEDLETTEGISGWFRQEPTERIAVAIEAGLALEGTDGNRRGRASVEVEKTTTIAEGTSQADRARRIYSLVEDAVTQFDERLVGQLRQTLSDYIGAQRA